MTSKEVNSVHVCDPLSFFWLPHLERAERKVVIPGGVAWRAVEDERPAGGPCAIRCSRCSVRRNVKKKKERGKRIPTDRALLDRQYVVATYEAQTVNLLIRGPIWQYQTSGVDCKFLIRYQVSHWRLRLGGNCSCF